jgi:hypothetical protein
MPFPDPSLVPFTTGLVKSCYPLLVNFALSCFYFNLLRCCVMPSFLFFLSLYFMTGIWVLYQFFFVMQMAAVVFDGY